MTTKVETRTICPAELASARPTMPTPADDAVIRTNPSGADWLAKVVGWAKDTAKLFDDAAAACPR